MMDDNDLATYVLRCADRFGSYGIVGFAVVRRVRAPSARFDVQLPGSEQAGGACVSGLAAEDGTVGDGQHDFLADLRKTTKNAPSSAVFAEMGFDEASTADGVTTLRFQKEPPIPDDGIVSDYG